METNETQEVELEQQINEEVSEEELAQAESTEDAELEQESEEEETDWKAEALKYKAIAIRNKKKKKEDVSNNITNKLQDKAENPGDEVVSRLSHLELAERKRQFGYEHALSPAETDRVFSISSNPSADTLKDPFIKAGLQAVRSQERVENNTPSSSAKSASLDRKKMSEMSEGDKQAAFESYMKSQGYKG